jgi:hypothetical protein
MQTAETSSAPEVAAAEEVDLRGEDANTNQDGTAPGTCDEYDMSHSVSKLLGRLFPKGKMGVHIKQLPGTANTQV